MYKTNQGIFCEEHIKGALIQQDSILGIEQFRDRLQSFGSLLQANTKGE
jgi:hypothetical protein